MKLTDNRTLPILLSILLARIMTLQVEGADRWSQFRGPNGQGHASAKDLPLRWSETENIRWRTELPGRGWSSPVAEGGQLWMTAAIDTPVSEEEEKRRLANNTGSQPLDVAASVSLRAVGVDQKSGTLLADVELLLVEKPQPVHTLNSYASPTPVIENGVLYCHFGDYGTAALDTQSKKVVWRNRELRLAHENGPGSSPILWKSHLIFHCDGSDVQFVAALEKKTGKVAWKTRRSGEMNANPQLKKAYGTPQIVRIGGRDQIVSPGANWLYSYDPRTGEELWKSSYGTLGFSIVPRPVVGEHLIYICTCFMRSELLAFDSRNATPGNPPPIAWRYKRQVSKMPSPILVDDSIYFVSDRSGILTCLDAETGEPRWVERLGGNYSASPIYADGHIFVSSREGKTTVLKPGHDFEKVADNELDGRHMASLLALGSALYARTDKALYRIEKIQTASD